MKYQVSKSQTYNIRQEMKHQVYIVQQPKLKQSFKKHHRKTTKRRKKKRKTKKKTEKTSPGNPATKVAHLRWRAAQIGGTNIPLEHCSVEQWNLREKRSLINVRY